MSVSNAEVEVVEDTRFQSRKWQALIAVTVLGVLFSLGDMLTPQLADLLKWAFGIYVTGNVGQKGLEWITDAIKIAQVLKKDKETTQ